MLWRYSPGPRFLPLVLFLGLVSFASAQQVSEPASAQERALTAERFTTERLAIWQKRLNLDDWSIKIVVSHSSDLKPKTLGNIHWDADTKSATIRVLHPSDYKLPTFQAMLDDMEFTVVHELIHLELASLPRSDASRRDEEYAVNRIADALLQLDHKK
jgi:hypothetical protein